VRGWRQGARDWGHGARGREQGARGEGQGTEGREQKAEDRGQKVVIWRGAWFLFRPSRVIDYLAFFIGGLSAFAADAVVVTVKAVAVGADDAEATVGDFVAVKVGRVGWDTDIWVGGIAVGWLGLRWLNASWLGFCCWGGRFDGRRL